MSVITQSLPLADGRVLEVFLGGDPAGYPLVMHHGTPADATTFADWHEACQARGMRLICASRPGYAASTRLAGRSVAQVAGDVSAILDWLGQNRFITAGWSGGGPHALACAALLSDRCAAAATLAGVGPFGADDLDFLAGMGPENVAEFGAAIEGEQALRQWMQENGEPYRSVTGEALAEAFGGLVPEVDKDVLVGGYANHFATVIRRSLEHGFNGWIDDDLAFTQPWEFSVGDIRIPVAVWQGELDLAVPFAHGRWLLNTISGAQGRMVAGHGHFSLVTRYRDEVLADLQRSAGQVEEG
ncbi:MAG TPA: alpha/beta hydrolase [Roseiflexaceae bacterium]|nr:alpha/beta hydrolase [Roseiflexaceae bacterium]